MTLHQSLLADLPNLRDVDVNFLQALWKTYRLRYPDDLELGFSVSLAQPKVITELDRTVHQIRRGFKFGKPSGESIETIIDRMIEKGDPDIVDSNCYFSSAGRVEVFQEFTNCYEMRVIAPNKILEAYYQARIPDDGDFPLEGLRPSAPNITRA